MKPIWNNLVLGLITLPWALIVEPGFAASGPRANVQKLRDAFRRGHFVAYTPSGYCPLPGTLTNATRDSVRADLETLKPYFDVLVTYSCNPEHGLDQVVPVAEELRLRVVLGIWSPRSVREIEAGVSMAKQYSNTVIGIIVGNETQLRGEKWEDLDAAIRLVRAALPSLPVSTSEPISSYGDPDLREIVDFHAPICMWIFQNQDHPNAKAAVEWMKGRLTALQDAPHGDKPILIKEHGLPSGPAPFTPQLQRDYAAMWLKEMPNTEKYTSSIFEAFDLPWKPKTNPSELGATEAFWGAWDNQRRAKLILTVLPKASASAANNAPKPSP